MSIFTRLYAAGIALLLLTAPIEAQLQRLSTRATSSIRLLPLGDSITYGGHSSDGNGYRLVLRNSLIKAGYSSSSIDFIGNISSGDNNPDNQNEGWSLNTIKNISDHLTSDRTLYQHPNIVLIHAGTNDMLTHYSDQPASTAPDRLGALMDQVLCESYDAVVLVAKLVQNTQNQNGTDAFNARVPDIVTARYNKGFKVRVVDQSGIGGNLSDDGVHPNDKGYTVMANNWMSAINALPANWLTTPRAPRATTSGSATATATGAACS